MSVHKRLYEFAGRYRIAVKANQPLSDHDKPLLSELVNSCIPHIPKHLHAEIYTSTCGFAAVKAKDQTFTIHVAFNKHNVIIKFKMQPPCGGSCSFCKLEEENITEKLIISNPIEVPPPESEENVSSKERDQLLMPPPPSRPRAPNRS